MVLSNNDIINLVNTTGLIESYSPSSVKNCSYKMRIGEIIEPESGKVLQFNNRNNDGYFIKPSEVVIIQSKEKLKLPNNITASYSALYSISREGLMLINSSMIEPGYYGYLSGFLMNFSAQKILISKEQEIAKVNFYKISSTPINFTTEIIDDSQYIKSLRNGATRYHKSFLDISGLQKKITSDVIGSVKKLAYSGGIIIFLLVLFASLEPLISRWLWEKTGVSSATEKYKMEVLLKDISQAKSDIEKMNEANNKIFILQNEVDSLKEAINGIKVNKK